MNVNIVPDPPEEDPVKAAIQATREAVQKSTLAALATLQTEPEKVAEEIKAKLIKALERDATAVMLSMMGFEKYWDEGWRIDHCNGRAGESPIGDITRTIFKDEGVKFVERNADKIFALTEEEEKEIIAALRAEFRARVNHVALRIMDQTVEGYLKGQSEKLLEEFTKFDIFEVTKRLNGAL